MTLVQVSAPKLAGVTTSCLKETLPVKIPSSEKGWSV